MDDKLNEVPKGEIGTVWIKGDSIAACYWNKHEKTKQSMIGEWFNTDDKFFMDEENLVKPCAYIVLNKEFSPSNDLEKEIKAYVKKELAHYKFPRWVHFVDELPKTATGKVKRFKLKQLEDQKLVSV